MLRHQSLDLELAGFPEQSRTDLERRHEEAFRPARQQAGEDISIELRRRCDLQLRDVPASPQDFVDRHDAIDRSQLTLPLRLV